MFLQIQVIPHTLSFNFAARTSRGAMHQHQVYYLKLYNPDEPMPFGLGECAPLPGLSYEYTPNFAAQLNQQVFYLNQKLAQSEIKNLEDIVCQAEFSGQPALNFAWETACRDIKLGGNQILYQNDFTQRQTGIPINGLIWMGDQEFMQTQIRQKLKEGYRCLKLKIGGLDFNTELAILAAVRAVAPAADLKIRLDANGAFNITDALPKLEQLAAFQIHSIEQPIRAGNWEAMQHLCRQSPIPIALDEELIGIRGKEQQELLLRTIAPAYIILKPTLLGGLAATQEWIDLAAALNIKYWITSALESNIGLNAISQFTAENPVAEEQGLGTGQLYSNNIASPLSIYQGKLFYQEKAAWDLSLFQNPAPAQPPTEKNHG